MKKGPAARIRLLAPRRPAPPRLAMQPATPAGPVSTSLSHFRASREFPRRGLIIFAPAPCPLPILATPRRATPRHATPRHASTLCCYIRLVVVSRRSNSGNGSSQSVANYEGDARRGWARRGEARTRPCRWMHAINAVLYCSTRIPSVTQPPLSSRPLPSPPPPHPTFLHS